MFINLLLNLLFCDECKEQEYESTTSYKYIRIYKNL